MRFDRRPENRHFSVNKTADRILRAISRYNFLSNKQLDRLLFNNSLSHVQKYTGKLFDAEYIQPIPFRKDIEKGSPRAIFTLDQKGYDYLKSLGIIPAGRFRATERVRRQPSTLEHTIAANDLLILTDRFCKLHEEFQIERFETESELNRHPVYVGTTSQKIAVKPDAWVLMVTDEHEYGIAWELDRGTEYRAAFRDHIRVRVYYSGQPYSREFGTESLTIAYVVQHGGIRRLERMLTLAEEELNNLKAQQVAPLFKFAVFDPEAEDLVKDPSGVFLSPIWYQPFKSDPVPLVLLAP